MVLEFTNGAVKAAVGVLGVLEKGGPLVGDLVIFVYTHGHMGRGLEVLTSGNSSFDIDSLQS